MALKSEDRSKIALRLVIDGSSEVAQSAWLHIQSLLAGLMIAETPEIRPYWKLVGSQEISTTLWPLDDAEVAFEGIAARLATGWANDTNDTFSRWAVWDGRTGKFSAPDVKWAHVELIRPASVS